MLKRAILLSFIILAVLLLTVRCPLADPAGVTVSWTQSPSQGVSGYKVYYSKTEGDLSTFISTDAVTFQYTFSVPADLDLDTWHFDIRAVNSYGSESSTGCVCTVDLTAPLPPPSCSTSVNVP